MISVVMAAAANGQRLTSNDSSELLHAPQSSGLSRVHDPTRARVRDFTPESHVPYRSPDLGSAYSPLSPSIGPGSSSLGPAAGPDASRRGSPEKEGPWDRNGRGSWLTAPP